MSEKTYSPHEISNKFWKTYVMRGLGRVCPRCGEGALFASRFRLAKHCDHCSLVYRREQGAMTGQLYLAAVVTQIFAALLIGIIWIFFSDWEPLFSIIVGLSILAIFSVWVLPKTTALWVVIEFMTDVGNRESWVLGETPNSDGDARS